MKLQKIAQILPVVLALAACGESKVSLKGNEQLVAETKTVAPVDYVVFPDDRPSIPDGKLVYDKQNCASCHGATGEHPDRKIQLNDQRWAAQQKPVDIYKFLAFGDEKSGHKPLIEPLTRRDLWDLVVYTRALGAPPLMVSADEHLAMEAVYGGNCAVCHGKRGQGDGPLNKPIVGSSVLPLQPNPANFTRFDRFYDRTDDVLYDHIANGIKWEGMPNFLGKEDRAKNVKFDHAYIRELVKYVREFSISNEPTRPESIKAMAEAKAAATKSMKIPSTAESTSAAPPLEKEKSH